MYHKRLEGGIIDLKSNQIVYNTWHLWYSIFKLMYKVNGLIFKVWLKSQSFFFN